MQFLLCHQKPERSFFWRGKQFPICARCTGIYTGYLSMPLFLFNLYSIPLIWTIIMIIPTLLDGLTQAYMNRESTNFIRFTSGLVAGVGLMALVAIVGQEIGNFLGNLIFL